MDGSMEEGARGKHIKDLLSKAENAEREDDWQTAQSLWLQLQLFLDHEMREGRDNNFHLQKLHWQCNEALIRIDNRPDTLQYEHDLVQHAFKVAGCTEPLEWDPEEGSAQLLDSLKDLEPFKSIRAAEGARAQKAAPGPAGPSTSGKENAATANWANGASGPTTSVPEHRQPAATCRPSVSGAEKFARAEEVHSLSGSINDWPQACSSGPASGGAASGGRSRRLVVPTISRPQQELAPAPRQQLPPPRPERQQLPPSRPERQQLQPDRPERQQLPRKRDNAGWPKPASETHVLQDGRAPRPERDRWATKPASSNAAPRRGAGGQEQPAAPSDDEENDVIEIDTQQGAQEAFQTAKTKLISDLRKTGKVYNPREYGGGGAPGGGGGAQGAAAGGGAGAPPVAPRAGLSRTGGRSLGLHKKPGAPPANPGVRGGFIPPYVRKAAEGGGEEPEGPLSAKVMEMLGCGPDGELPEALQKVDPAILEMVCNEVLDTGCAMSWDDIAGQDQAKRLVQELVVWPMLNPHLFTGPRAPPKGLLLFGPPGTGKTLIGKAIASNISATFFNISASSLTSKWIGEGEKMVRALFAVAQHLQPSVIFIDEIDSILSARKADGEHEASRRLKTEILVQMDGCDPSAAAARVLLVGATNRPEELDEAARRRMPKQLYIPLPCAAARTHMVLRQLGPGASVRASLSEADVAKLVDKTAGYSGSDMRNLIQEACQGPVRDAVAQHGARVAELSEADLRPVVLRDFQVAAKAQRASVEPSEVVRYEQYNAKHGARYVDPLAAADELDEDDW